MNRYLLQILLIIFFSLCVQPSYVSAIQVAGYDIDDVSVSKLPDYLQVRLKHHYNSTHPDYQRWAKFFAPDYSHMHHYAFGLVYLDMSKDLKGYDREFRLNKAISEFQYVLNRSSEKNPILPQIYNRKGDAHIYLQNYVEAAVAYEKSIMLKNDDMYPYRMLSHCYKLLKMDRQAQDILRLGEKNSLKLSDQGQ